MIKIPPSFIESTLEAQDIKYKHNPQRSTFQIYNPFLEDTDYHMGLNYKIQVYHCFKTGQKGSLFSFFQKILKMNEFELMKKIKSYDFEPIQLSEEPKIKQHVITPLNTPEDWYLIKDLKSNLQCMHFNYLRARNISEDKIYRNKFYYSTTDIYRTIIPYYIHNKLVYYTSRDITGKRKKYLYPKDCPNNNGNVIYNFDHCDKDNLIICEGQINSLIVNGIAVGGSGLSQDQLKLIRILEPKKITIAFDQDLPGKQAMLKIIGIVYKYFKDLYYLDSEVTKEDFADLGEERSMSFIDKYTKKYTLENILDTEVRTKLYDKR